MGRQVINHRLLNKMDYSNIKVLKGAIGSMYNLQENGMNGDSVALSIYIDVHDAVYGQNSPLNDKQKKAIDLNLVHCISQYEVAEMMGMSQRMVNHYSYQELRKISEFLMKGVDDDG